jgi:hypothetical protein
MLALVTLTGTSGGLAYFSPYTLEYQTQLEFTIIWGALPVYRSQRRDADNELAAFLRQEGFMTSVRPEAQRWELVFHWNHAWRDGYGPLYDVLIRHRREIIEWSQADPKRAQLYWSESFKHLRSDNKIDVLTGQLILISCWHSQSTQELREQIARVKKESRSSAEPVAAPDRRDD